jgi:hypothetical protein
MKWVELSLAALCLVLVFIFILNLPVDISCDNVYLRRQHLTHLLRKTCECFNQENIEYWVDFGSLLGIHRENGVILGDGDADICIINLSKKKFKRAAHALRAHNLSFRKVFFVNMYRVSTHGCTCYLDCYVNVASGDTYIGATGKTSNIPMRFVGKPRLIDWGATKVRVPENVEATLTWRYGDDFMQPKPNFKGRARQGKTRGAVSLL